MDHSVRIQLVYLIAIVAYVIMWLFILCALRLVWRNIGNKTVLKNRLCLSIYWVLNILCATPIAFGGFILGGNFGGAIIAEITDTYDPQRAVTLINIGIIFGIIITTLLLSILFSILIKFLVDLIGHLD